MEVVLLIGAYSRITALQEFCIIASVGLLADFFLEVMLYVSILSLDLRRIDLSDLARIKKSETSSSQAEPLLLPEQFVGVPDATVGPAKYTWIATYSRLKQHRLIVWNNLLALLVMVATLILALLGGADINDMRTDPHPLQPLKYWGFSFLSKEHSSRFTGFLPATNVSIGDQLDLQSAAADETFALALFGWSGKLLRWVPEPLRSPWVILACFAAVMLLISVCMTIIRYLRWLVFGERVGVDAVEAFGVVQNFDVCTLAGHRQDIECLTMKDSSQIISACLDGQVRIWNVDSQRCVQAFEPDSPDDTPWSLTTQNNFVAIGYGDGRIKVLNLHAGESCLLPEAGPGPGEGERNTHDGGGITCLKFNDSTLFSASSTGVVQAWVWESEELQGGTELLEERAEDHERDVQCAEHGRRRSSARRNSQSSHSCPTCGSHGNLVAYFQSFDAETSKAQMQPPVDDGERLPSAAILTGSLADDRTILNTFKRVHTQTLHKAGINVMTITDRHVITASADRLIKVSNRNLTCVHTLYGHSGSVTTIDIHETTLVSGSVDHSIRVWDTETGECKHELTKHTGTSTRRSVWCAIPHSIMITHSIPGSVKRRVQHTLVKAMASQDLFGCIL